MQKSEAQGYKWELLQEPFPSEEIEWRIARSGMSNQGPKKVPWAMVFAYVTNRGIQKRMDDVFGPSNWQCTFHMVSGENGISPGVVCSLGVRIPRPDGQEAEWVWKEDGAPQTDFEAFKGGISDAMKRAAVQWGIGRYLYKLDSGFATLDTKKLAGFAGKVQIDGKWYYWAPPLLPKWALPTEQAKDAAKIERGGCTCKANTKTPGVKHEDNCELYVPF